MMSPQFLIAAVGYTSLRTVTQPSIPAQMVSSVWTRSLSSPKSTTFTCTFLDKQLVPYCECRNDSSALPRNYLSNYYGGMDVYVQEFGAKKTHDEFYTNKNIRKAFYKYVRFIVSRYANEPGIIAWELANDAECASTLPSSDQCNTNTLTRWHAETAKFIRSIDCNHLIAS
ncbi:glycoside hydrolase superfamily, partial [Russula aff. rugulosa BPL654]